MLFVAVSNSLFFSSWMITQITKYHYIYIYIYIYIYNILFLQLLCDLMFFKLCWSIMALELITKGL